jgi:hypothetical protein
MVINSFFIILQRFQVSGVSVQKTACDELPSASSGPSSSSSYSSLVLDKILIPEDEYENEDEDEKYQIRSHA